MLLPQDIFVIDFTFPVAMLNGLSTSTSIIGNLILIYIAVRLIPCCNRVLPLTLLVDSVSRNLLYSDGNWVLVPHKILPGIMNQFPFVFPVLIACSDSRPLPNNFNNSKLPVNHPFTPCSGTLYQVWKPSEPSRRKSISRRKMIQPSIVVR